jgi:hypothetical protein
MKTDSAKTTRTPGPRCAWPDVLRALSSDESRSTAIARFRAAGFTADDFGHVPSARSAMCDSLTRAEDALELKRGSSAATERAAIKIIRRRLEAELS